MRANLPRELGRRVKELRQAAGISQRELAQRMGTTQSVIARLEAGGSKPSLRTLERLAEAVGREVEVRFREPHLVLGKMAAPPKRSMRTRPILDLAQLAANLRLSPAQRLTRATAFSRWVLRNRGRALAPAGDRARPS